MGTSDVSSRSSSRSVADLPTTVLLLGLTSLLTDVSSEMIFPLLPIFLSSSLAASATFLGLVEGAADSVSSLLKLVAGVISDRTRRRKPLVVLGYGLASLVRPLVGLATAPWHVLAIRVSDRVGKGLRSAPRDALIADAAPAGKAGRAFGFHRAMDHAGAVLGPILATVLLAVGFGLRSVFLFAAIPAAAAFAVVLVVRETRVDREPEVHAGSPARDQPQVALPRALRAYLLVLGLFCLGNSSDAFLLLRARDLGLSIASIPILWAVLHIAKLSSTYLGGDLSDRIARPWLIVGGWCVFGATYLGLGYATRPWHVWVLFVLYGVYYGLTEPAEKALVKDLAPAQARGRAYGFYHLIAGASALPASLLTGWLWKACSPKTALVTGAGFAIISVLMMLVFVRAPAPGLVAPNTGDR